MYGYGNEKFKFCGTTGIEEDDGRGEVVPVDVILVVMFEMEVPFMTLGLPVGEIIVPVPFLDPKAMACVIFIILK